MQSESYVAQMHKPQERDENKCNIFKIDDLVYIHETCNLKYGKCWQSLEIFRVIGIGNKSCSIIVLRCGGEMSFLANNNLLFKASASTGITMYKNKFHDF